MGRVFISVDMEGLTGVVSPNQVLPGRADYELFRKVMLRETNAVIRGAFDGGADGVLVNDSHDGMLNLKIEGLDERAELISGYHKPLSMVQGIDGGFVCAFFVGYHSMASGEGVLSHTMSGIVSRAYLNGVPASEGVINAAVAGYFGVPVGLVAGDQYAVSEVHAVCPDARGAVVKRAIDRYSALSESLTHVEEELRRAAEEAVKSAGSLRVYSPAKPITLTVEFAQSSLAARALYAPIARRVDSRTIEIVGENPLDVYMRFRACLGLASTAHDPDYG